MCVSSPLPCLFSLSSTFRSFSLNLYMPCLVCACIGFVAFVVFVLSFSFLPFFGLFPFPPSPTHYFQTIRKKSKLFARFFFGCIFLVFFLLLLLYVLPFCWRSLQAEAEADAEAQLLVASFVFAFGLFGHFKFVCVCLGEL